MKKGDLVWMPSDITLLQVDKKEVVTNFIRLTEPNHAVVLEEGEIYYKVMVDGQTWEARKCDVYNVVENRV